MNFSEEDLKRKERKVTWCPAQSSGFETKDIHGGRLYSERVSFIPDVTIECYPPYIEGKPDCAWVEYRYRPTTKEGWEKMLGMSLQTML
jgi:hypothetical protein